MKETPAPNKSKILTLKVALEYIEPPIWRRFEVEDTLTLGDLHFVLQSVMDWENAHLHKFKIRGNTYSSKDSFGCYDACENDDEYEEADVQLRDLFKQKGAKFEYLYDFGDSWLHEVVVEKISDPEPGVRYPRCIAGERCCPPEDCGGIPGYYSMLEALDDPEDEDYDMYIEWLGDEFDPEAFDIAEVNRRFDWVTQWMNMAEDDADSQEAAVETWVREYDEPVSHLLTLGEPLEQLEYASLGIGHDHIPELVRMASDMALHEADSESPVVWAPVHAWRALGQMQSEKAIHALVQLLHLADATEDDYACIEIPEILGAFGSAAIPELTVYMQDPTKIMLARASAAESLGQIAEAHPETRNTCVAVLTQQLERFAETDPDLNAFVISALIDMKAVESAAIIEQAFAEDAVDQTMAGDWSSVRADLGLAPKSRKGRSMAEGSAQKPASSSSAARKPKQKTKKKRKEQKAVRKKNRKK